MKSEPVLRENREFPRNIDWTGAMYGRILREALLLPVSSILVTLCASSNLNVLRLSTNAREEDITKLPFSSPSDNGFTHFSMCPILRSKDG
jgi:hypothetical protein